MLAMPFEAGIGLPCGLPFQTKGNVAQSLTLSPTKLSDLTYQRNFCGKKLLHIPLGRGKVRVLFYWSPQPKNNISC